MANPLDILIVGGSVSGLVCGITLKHAGHNVCIVEREPDRRESHMSGLGLSADFKTFLSLHDRLESPFFLHSTGVRHIDTSNGTETYFSSVSALTSWDTLYYRLRALFDGYTTESSPIKPLDRKSDGFAEFKSPHELLNVRSNPGTQKIVANIKNLSDGNRYEKQFDYVIGADGSNSVIRRQYLPSSKPRYTGYIGLRGTVPESELTPETRQLFATNITLLQMDKQNCVVYTIPGLHGSLQPGERLVNFLWYHNETVKDLDTIMIGRVSGTRHRSTVPAGHVREDVWTRYLHIAISTPFPPQYLELITKIRRPFIQVISQSCSPKASFENGRVLLVGNAVSLFRPHTASSGVQAAFHALETERLLRGEIALERWEERVLRFSWLHWAQAEYRGAVYQSGSLVVALKLMRFWYVCAVDRVKAWWGGEDRLLRNGTESKLEFKND